LGEYFTPIFCFLAVFGVCDKGGTSLGVRLLDNLAKVVFTGETCDKFGDLRGDDSSPEDEPLVVFKSSSLECGD